MKKKYIAPLCEDINLEALMAESTILEIATVSTPQSFELQ